MILQALKEYYERLAEEGKDIDTGMVPGESFLCNRIACRMVT